MDCTVYTQRKGLYTVEHTHTNVLDCMGLHSIHMSNNLLNYSHIGTIVVQPPSQCHCTTKTLDLFRLFMQNIFE
jgi:hypothetical protein